METTESTYAQKTFLNDEFWEFVRLHQNEDPARLRLSAHTFRDVTFDISAAILQIDARKRFAKKLSQTLALFPKFYFPDLLAGEQSTGDAAACYHINFIPEKTSLVDMTAGLGIDLTHLARKASSAVGVERREHLAEILRWNAAGLGLSNVEVLEGDSVELLDTLPKADTVFIDPARRASDGSRVFGLSDCEPDVTSLLPSLKEKYNRLVIKASPMLDIAQTIKDLRGTTNIYILGTPTECKELDAIVDLNPDADVEPRIHAVTLNNDGKPVEFTFTRAEEAEAPVPKTKTPEKGHFLYVPAPAVMKAAPIKLLAEKFGVDKLANNTHLYTSTCKREFPGETLEITEVIQWQSKNIKRLKTRYPQISVSTRNFGMSADALRSKLGVKDGGNERLFGVTTADDKRLLLVCRPA